MDTSLECGDASDQSPKTEEQAPPKASPEAGTHVSGDSPCYYAGDPSKHSLNIESLTLSPKKLGRSSRLTIALNGTIRRDAGPDMAVSLKAAKKGGGIGPSISTRFRAARNPYVEMTQNGSKTLSPASGAVHISYKLNVPGAWLKKGFYSLEARVTDSERQVMTEFDAQVWMSDDGTWSDARGLMG